MIDRSWQLMQAHTLLGTLTLDEIDQPWFRCHFTGTQAWEDVRPVLEEWTHSIEPEEPDPPKVDQALRSVDALHLALVPTDGNEPIDDFLIHIRGSRASFRY
ncbi:hypothetical protein ACFCZY_22695 [Streptomyces sp. NPDC056237]|uniref:hypothetical protein n=1 Tax=Streptomyces sp. NPDC056237 TaxID=3345758 RepID=UPI0035DACFEB